ncbi:MAG: hypothetical protein KIT87_08720 [Anaerolineae bacterium]|nr:hypothetical protein [Anaerolineae bacterium]
MDLHHALQRALDRHKHSIVALSEDLIRIASENPPAPHYAECVSRLRLELERLGLSHEILETPGPFRPPALQPPWRPTATANRQSCSTATTTSCRRSAATSSSRVSKTAGCTAGVRRT